MRDLKQGYTALEERARNDLGMIGGNETFFQVAADAASGCRLCAARQRSVAAARWRTAARLTRRCTTGW